MPGPVVVEFLFAPTSRYAYLASTQMLKLQLETGCRVDWLPIDFRALQRAAGLDTHAFGKLASGQYDIGWRTQDAFAWAELYGVPFREPADVAVPAPERLTQACLVARSYDAGQVFARRLFQACFVEALSPIDDAALAALAEEVAGIEPAAFLPALDAPETAAEHDRILRRARSAGCFGVPSFIVEGKMFWGNDRLPLVRHAITKARQAAG